MLNERIKELRTSKMLSQVQLADRLGVTKQCVSNWENNNIQPSIDMLIKIALFFHTTTDFLLGIDDRKYLDITALTPRQAAHLQNIVDDLSEKRL